MNRKNGSDANNPRPRLGAWRLLGGPSENPILSLAAKGWTWVVLLGLLTLRLIAAPSRWLRSTWKGERSQKQEIPPKFGKPHPGQETTPPPIFPLRRTMFLKAKKPCSRGLGNWLSGTIRAAPNYTVFTNLTGPIVALKTETDIEKSINSQDFKPTWIPQKRSVAHAAHARRQTVGPIPSLQTVILPRPAVRTGLPTRKGLKETSVEVSVGPSTLWRSAWTTVGEELPRDSDWRWYAAITSRCLSTEAPPRVELGSKEDLYRLGRELGGKVQGGIMEARCKHSLTRLAQVRFGWAEVPKDAPESSLSMAPIIEMSSGLAWAIWRDDPPAGVATVDDDSYWIGLTEQHQQILVRNQFRIPAVVFRRVAKRASNLSIALWLAAIAQSAQKEYHPKQEDVEAFVSRITSTPPENTLQALNSAVMVLTNALEAEGYKDAIKVDLVREDRSKTKKPRGRPRNEWDMTIHPARGKPFKTRKIEHAVRERCEVC